MTRWQGGVTSCVCALCLTSCKSEVARSEAPPKPAVAAALVPGAPTPAPPAAGLVAPTGAATGEAVPAFATDHAGHMRAHFIHAMKLQDAVLAGKLDDARAQGKWLAEHEAEDVPPAWKPYLKTFQLESKSVAEARTIDDAAVGVSHIAAACGACHEGNKAKPHITHQSIVQDAQNIKQHMGDQLAALDRMWEGLVAPSDAAWTDGAALLAKVVVSAKSLKKEGKAEGDSAILVDTLQQIAASAGNAERKDRSRAYADLLTTCVACHAAVRK